MDQPETHFISRQLFRSIAHSFEQLVFFETSLSDVEELQQSPSITGFAIEITEPYNGQMVILGEEELFSAITQQFFGSMDVPGSSDPLHDMGCELANTIAGHFMAELYPDKTFRLGLPTKIGDVPDHHNDDITICCQIEDMQFFAFLTGSALIDHAQPPISGSTPEDAHWDDPFAEADAAWGQGPETNPETGQSAATRRWGQ